MEIFKNKTSGKYFIGLDYKDDETALMITPQGEVKRLELHLFEYLETIDSQILLDDQLIAQTQLEKYEQYLDTLLPRS